ncbi:hypothetical protein MLD38_010891 [Melastoma candidum]|uniref:Uncharacterized protein n=1 Tax=Melastoma candidum TaxID=119954 RepID=A0ACB9R0T8_9MYRT|nr:hypothetical protein MLD38_010891 [Melastoma candidum]
MYKSNHLLAAHYNPSQSTSVGQAEAAISMKFSSMEISGGSSVGPGQMTYRRDLPPAHYSMKIENFSLLLESKVDKYDSGAFEAGGYKWSLSLCPNGDKRVNATGFVSFYLAIEETGVLPRGWEVDVNFKLFVYDKIRNTYVVIEDGEGTVRRFHDLKRDWGFSLMISLETFKEPSNGFLVDDSCIFGTEVFVIKPTGKWESLTMIKQPTLNNFTWKINRLSKLTDSFLFSDAFTVGESSWKLKVFPQGNKAENGKLLTIFLELVGASSFSPKRKLYAEYNLRVVDQLNANNRERKVKHWFSSSYPNWGYPNFMPLEDLHQPVKGFVYNDSLIIEAEILIVSKCKVFS